ncbi:helix-turn-helix domain-containing protein [Terriglobus albidus]|uniref:helix-turn-helix domain-containing protein n=1 Tax=Terriglobus albidus TaxID=1592106 RepID=UPI0021E02B7D|nr:helix-turn-helix domain-containing protein [Terriglobus albidus]
MALMTQEQVAEELQVPVSRVKRWRWHGRGPAYVELQGKEVRYRPEDVQAYIEANRKIPLMSAEQDLPSHGRSRTPR